MQRSSSLLSIAQRVSCALRTNRIPDFADIEMLRHAFPEMVGVPVRELAHQAVLTAQRPNLKQHAYAGFEAYMSQP
jgi:hypothetical protein